MRRIPFLLGLLLAVFLDAQAPPPSGPALLPGEGLAIACEDDQPHLYGETAKESPMGSLAKLVWLRWEGEEWAAHGVSFKCTGEQDGLHCWLPKGHGKVDLAKATQESCNLAFLTWARISVMRWEQDMGPGAARMRLEEGFRPFLGNRMPQGELPPVLGPEWIGDGELLRTSPEAMLRWLMDPDQAALLSRCRRLFLGFFGSEFKKDRWWMKTGTAPVPGEPGATSAWVAGSNGRCVAVLHLPRGKARAEGLERFKAILGLPKGK